MTGAIGHVENGTIHLSEQVDWSGGQRVLVIALPARRVGAEAPPDDLLEEDAQEFSVRRDAIADINRDELG
jgi:hypothetical protein